MAPVTDTYYGTGQHNRVYRVTLIWETDEAGVRTGRPDVIVDQVAEFEVVDDALAFVRAWNQND